MNKNLSKKTFILACLLLFFAASNAQNIFEIEVAPQKVSCQGNAENLCYKVRFRDSANWEIWNNEIDGFVFQEGFYYRIMIKIESQPEKKISFIELIEKTESGGSNKNQINGKYVMSYYKGVAFNPTDTIFINQVGFHLKYCNNMSGEISNLTEDKISFTKIVSTKMACLDGFTPSEFDFVTALQSVVRYSMAGGTLNLFNAKNEKVLEFEKIQNYNNNEKPPIAGANKSFYGSTTLSLYAAADSAIVKRKMGRKMQVNLLSPTGKGKLLLSRDADSKAGKFILYFENFSTLQKMQIIFNDFTSYTTSFYQTTEIHRENIIIPGKDLKKTAQYQKSIKIIKRPTGGYKLSIPASIMSEYPNIYLYWWNKL